MEEVVRKIMDKRRTGKSESTMQGFDLLSQVMADQEENFTDQDILNNMLGFMFGSTETMSFASQTLISHLIQSKSSLEKVRKEFDDIIRKPAIK